MHLDDIRTLRLVAECASFTAAAAALHMSQSAVSQRIRQLERELGISLFVRQGRGVKLSPEGEIVRRFAEDLDAGVFGLQRDLARAGAVRTLSIGAPPAVSSAVLPALLEKFRQVAGDVLVKVSTVVGPEVRSALLAGELDFGVVLRHQVASDLETELLLTERYVLIARRDHELAQRGGQVTPEEVARHPMIDLLIPPEGRSILRQWSKLHGVKANPMLEVDSTAALVTSVRAGLGIGLAIGAAAAAMGAGAGQIAVLDAPTGMDVPLYLAYRRGPERSDAVRLFLETLRGRSWREAVPSVAT